MNIEFWNLAQDTLEHTLEIYSIKEDSDSISGLEFYSNEAKTCTIEFFEDSWTLANLRNITSSDCIDDTRIIKKVIKFTTNGINRTYYLDQFKIEYNKKTISFKISGIDLLGLLLKLSETTKNFSTEKTESINLLTDTISDILDNSSIQYSIINNANSQNVPVSDYPIPLQHDDYSQYLEGDCFWEENPYESEGRWKWIGEEDDDIVIYFYYKKEWGCPDDEGSQKIIVVYKYKLINEVIPQLVRKTINFDGGGCPASLPSSIDGHDPTVCNLSYSTEDRSYSISGDDLIFSGTVYFEEITIQADDEGSSEYKQNEVLKALLLLNNIYCYSQGNNLYLGNKIGFSGTAINILDNSVLEFKENYITFKDIDTKDVVSVFESVNVFANFLNFYYNELKETFNQEIICEIENVYDIKLLDIITIYGIDYVIVEIGIDLDDFVYTIKAWSI